MSDRQVLRQAIQSPDEVIADVMEWAKERIRNQGRSKEEIGEDGYLVPLASLPPGAAHLAAALRYQERNIAEGKCSVCGKPQDPNSVRYCTTHLARERTKSARKRGARGEPGSRDYRYGEISESTHGRQPGTLASLAINREKKTRALLAELGISPENAAVRREDAKKALLAAMPDTAHALRPKELLEKAGVICKTTGERALPDLLAEKRIQRTNKGGMREPRRYFGRKGNE